MNIAIDANIPGTADTFARHGKIQLIDGRHLQSAQLQDTQALIVRSVTVVNSELLNGTAVEFVGSATIGTDHLDIPWLESQGIRYASAPGCNADAAAQYTLAMILLACQRCGLALQDLHVGIVGHGNVGRGVLRLLTTIGVQQFSICDPPLADAGGSGYRSLEQVANCDIISIHAPLTATGKYPTWRMVNADFLDCTRNGALLVNAARGDIISGPAFLQWLRSGRGSAALDVYPGEPAIDPDLLEACIVATPHVAGYSLDGKVHGTLAVYRQFCHWLRQEPGQPDLLGDLPGFNFGPQDFNSLSGAVLTACPVERDDRDLRSLLALDRGVHAAFFDDLRKNYPPRRDFAGWKLPGGLPKELIPPLKSLGFR